MTIRGISNNSEKLNLICKIVSKTGQMLLILFLEARTVVYMRLRTPKAKMKLDSSEWDSRKDFNKIRRCPEFSNGKCWRKERNICNANIYQHLACLSPQTKPESSTHSEREVRVLVPITFPYIVVIALLLFLRSELSRARILSDCHI